MQPFRCAYEARTALRLSPRVGNHSQPLQAVSQGCSVSHLFGDDHRFLEQGCGAGRVTAGEGHLCQVVERIVGAVAVSYPVGQRQPLLKHGRCFALLTAHQLYHPQKGEHQGHAVVGVDISVGSQSPFQVGDGRLVIAPFHRRHPYAGLSPGRHELILYLPGKLQGFFEILLPPLVVAVTVSQRAGDRERLRPQSWRKIVPKQHRLHPPEPLALMPASPPNSHSAQPIFAAVSTSPAESAQPMAALKLPFSFSSESNHSTWLGPRSSCSALSTRVRKYVACRLRVSWASPLSSSLSRAYCLTGSSIL